MGRRRNTSSALIMTRRSQREVSGVGGITFTSLPRLWSTLQKKKVAEAEYFENENGFDMTMWLEACPKWQTSLLRRKTSYIRT